MTRGGAPEDKVKRWRLHNQQSALQFWQKRAREALEGKNPKDFGYAAMMVLVMWIAITKTVG